MSVRHPALTRFGRNVRRQREAIGLSQEALAEKADLDRTYVSGIERGVRNPTILSVSTIACSAAESIGLSADELAVEAGREHAAIRRAAPTSKLAPARMGN
jgi:transcriptional regulator with XRE-family HTH domain